MKSWTVVVALSVFCFFLSCTALTSFKDYSFTAGDGDADADGDSDADGNSDGDTDTEQEPDELEVILSLLTCFTCDCYEQSPDVWSCPQDSDITEGPLPVTDLLLISLEVQNDVELVQSVDVSLDNHDLDCNFEVIEGIPQCVIELRLTEPLPPENVLLDYGEYTVEARVVSTTNETVTREGVVRFSEIDPKCDLDNDFSVSHLCDGPDCNDQNDQIHPGAPEMCGNNEDDNCDGFTDAQAIESLTQLSENRDSVNPVIFHSNTSLYAAWTRPNAIEITEVRPGEAPVLTYVLGRSPDVTSAVDIHYADFRFAVAWVENDYDITTRHYPVVMYQIFNDEWTALSEVVTTLDNWSHDLDFPSVSHNGTHFGMVFQNDLNGSLYFMSFNDVGGVMVPPVMLFDNSSEGYRDVLASLTWIDSQSVWVVAFERQASETSLLRVAIIDENGAVIETELLDASGQRPQIASTGDSVGVVWAQTTPMDFIRFAQVEWDGTRIHIDEPINVSNITTENGLRPWPALEWNGEHFGIAWSGQDNGEIRFATVNLMNLVRNETLVHQQVDQTMGFPSVTYFDGIFGLVWQSDDDRLANQFDIYFEGVTDCNEGG